MKSFKLRRQILMDRMRQQFESSKVNFLNKGLFQEEIDRLTNEYRAYQFYLEDFVTRYCQKVYNK
jgi:hypothetical protein